MGQKKTTKTLKISGAFGYKHSKAQHLVELVLFFPFLIGIIGLLTEIAYGLNTGIELNSALNRAIGIVSSAQKSNSTTQDTIREEIQNNTYDILVKRKVPYANTLKVETLEVDDFLVSIATYNYTYAFKLVNMFFSAVPEKFYFKSVSIANKSLFKPNSYDINNNSLTNDFSAYNQAGLNSLETRAQNLYNNYKNRWNKDHEDIWDDYVDEIKQEQENNSNQTGDGT